MDAGICLDVEEFAMSLKGYWVPYYSHMVSKWLNSKQSFFRGDR